MHLRDFKPSAYNYNLAMQELPNEEAAGEEDTPVGKDTTIPASVKKVTPASTRKTPSGNKENTPAAANRQKKEPKRKSDTRGSHPSTG